jgi:hypothetical protein
MTIAVHDDFSGAGNLDSALWDDTSTSFWYGQNVAHQMQQSGGYATVPVTKAGEAVTHVVAGGNDQYVEFSVRDTSSHIGGVAAAGFRFSGSPTAASGIAVEVTTNSTGFVYDDTQCVVAVYEMYNNESNQDYLGAGSGGYNVTGLTPGAAIIVRLEVVGATITLKVNGVTIATLTESHVASGTLGLMQLTNGGLSSTAIDYFEFGYTASGGFWTDFSKSEEA